MSDRPIYTYETMQADVGVNLLYSSRDLSRFKNSKGVFICQNFRTALAYTHYELCDNNAYYPQWTWLERVMLESIMMGFCGSWELEAFEAHKRLLLDLLTQQNRPSDADALIESEWQLAQDLKTFNVFIVSK